MHRFTYHLKAEPLKSHVLMLRVMVSVDAVVMPLIAFFLPRPWNWMLFVFAVIFVTYSQWLVGRPLRGRHVVDERSITLVAGRRLVTIARSLIVDVQRFDQPLPERLQPVITRYLPAEDTLFILPDKNNLVRLTLREAVETEAPKQGKVEFTKVVFAVDEPDAFIAAVGVAGDAIAGASPHGRRLPDTAAPLPGMLLPVHASSSGGTPLPAGSSLADQATQGALELQGLAKRFGDFTAVSPLSLSVETGEVLAFLGSNGAGKSTTMKMIVGLLRPSGGQVLVHGKSLWGGDLSLRRHIGYVPDTPMLYENLTAREHLWLVGGLYDLPQPEVRRRSDELLAQLGLMRHGNQLVRSFSLGMKRKLAIASALLHRPSILLLDEATNGLDPRAAREVKDFIAETARSGTAVLLTTHLLDVVSELAHRIAVIDDGKLQAVGTLAELQRAVGEPQATLEQIFLRLTAGYSQEVSA